MATTRVISYDAVGRTMVGTLALPAGDGTRPGVLVCHQGSGIDDHARHHATRLADELGYVAFALDYHGGGESLSGLDEITARTGELRADARLTRALGRAGLDVLCAEGRTDTARLAAIGYCFGGAVCFELARDGAELKAAVGFHGELRTTLPAQAGRIRAKMLALVGADDPLVGEAQRRTFEDEMRTAAADWQLYVYGGAGHSFTSPGVDRAAMPGVAYHEATDRRSWRAMVDLFDEVFA